MGHASAPKDIHHFGRTTKSCHRKSIPETLCISGHMGDNIIGLSRTTIGQSESCFYFIKNQDHIIIITQFFQMSQVSFQRFNSCYIAETWFYHDCGYFAMVIFDAFFNYIKIIKGQTINIVPDFIRNSGTNLYRDWRSPGTHGTNW